MDDNLEIAGLISKGFKMNPRYEGRLMVNQKGEVYSLFSHKLLKVSLLPSGYVTVVIMIQKPIRHSRTEYIHRLVADTFLQNPLNKKTVNHKDGDKQNNCIENLEWATQGENNLHAVRVLGRKINTLGIDQRREKQKKFTPEIVRQIRKCSAVEDAYAVVFSAGIQCSKYTVWDCYHRRTYCDV